MNIVKSTEKWFLGMFESAGEQVILFFQTIAEIKDVFFRRDKVIFT